MAFYDEGKLPELRGVPLAVGRHVEVEAVLPGTAWDGKGKHPLAGPTATALGMACGGAYAYKPAWGDSRAPDHTPVGGMVGTAGQVHVAGTRIVERKWACWGHMVCLNTVAVHVVPMQCL